VPDVCIRMVEEPGEHLLHPREEAALVVGEIAPHLDAVVARRQLRVRRYDPHLLLAGKDAVAGGVPAIVEAPAVLLYVPPRDVVRRVSRAERQVKEERRIGRERLLIPHEGDGAIDEVLCQVVAGPVRRQDPLVAGGEVWVPLVGLAAEETVVVLKASAERPLLERPCGRRV